MMIGSYSPRNGPFSPMIWNMGTTSLERSSIQPPANPSMPDGPTQPSRFQPPGVGRIREYGSKKAKRIGSAPGGDIKSPRPRNLGGVSPVAFQFAITTDIRWACSWRLFVLRTRRKTRRQVSSFHKSSGSVPKSLRGIAVHCSSA